MSLRLHKSVAQTLNEEERTLYNNWIHISTHGFVQNIMFCRSLLFSQLHEEADLLQAGDKMLSIVLSRHGPKGKSLPVGLRMSNLEYEFVFFLRKWTVDIAAISTRAL